MSLTNLLFIKLDSSFEDSLQINYAFLVRNLLFIDTLSNFTFTLLSKVNLNFCLSFAFILQAFYSISKDSVGSIYPFHS